MPRLCIPRPVAFVALCAVLAASGTRAEPPTVAPLSTSDRAPPQGWKLPDLTDTMQKLRGRSYAKGKQLFEKALCVTCHRQDNVGAEFGPDLTKLDPRFQPLDILRDVLDPSRRIADAKFDTWVFQTDSGLVATGLIQQETDEVVKVLEKPPAAAQPVVLKKSGIETRKMSLVSIMPQGLLDKLTRDEIADLIAYVAARGDPSDPLVTPDNVAPENVQRRDE